MAWPVASRVEVPRAVVPSKKVTVPVAMEAVPVETDAERVTGCRALAGLGVATRVVVVGRPLMVWVTVAALAANAPVGT